MIPIQHGGNPSEVRRRLGLGDRPLVDLSASFNPLGPPPSALDAARSAIDRVDGYSEPGCQRLVERLAEFHQIPADRVIVGAGATELIGLIGESLREVLAFHAQALGDPTKPLSHLVDPTYAEYRRISKHNELRAKVWGEHILGWRQDVFPVDANGIFWTGHPNNPTGLAWDRSTLLDHVARTLGLLTIVDETSLPFLADEADRTLIPSAARLDNLLVIRSFSKFYAMPGLRVGYAIAPPDMVTRLRQFQDPWTVSPPAEAAAIAALDDREYAERSVDFVAKESARVIERLWEIQGIRPVWPERKRPDQAPPLPNFLLVSLTQTDWDSGGLQEALARRGILVRECSDFSCLEVGALLTGPDQLVATRGQIRIGLGLPGTNDALLAHLEELLEAGPTG
jgi:threonine-phosphate decarboxylase